MEYRYDIDGLRALAVTAVIIFHLGFLKNGYLGVDIFFVISGFLISGIIYNENLEGKFTIKKFYERRIRRILPLLFFCSCVVLPLGILFMFPQDLYKLARAVIASNLSVNNILMYLTSGGYWEPINDFKPMMHTWSLGIEEQFYIIYPILFLFFPGKKSKYIGPALLFLTAISLILFYIGTDSNAKFFLLQYRFFELSIGGLGAIFLSKYTLTKKNAELILVVSLLVILVLLFNLFKFSNEVNIILIIISTTALLLTGRFLTSQKGWYSALFENPVALFLGKISFSLYMWHQIVFAFARVTILREINVFWGILLSIVTTIISYLTYQFIENYFRDRKKISLRNVLLSLGFMFLLSNGLALYILSYRGILKDFPALNVYKNQISMSSPFVKNKGEFLLEYNNRILGLHKTFTTNKKRIVFVGDSYSRDAANIFLESAESSKIEVRAIVIEDLLTDPLNKEILAQAEKIVISEDTYEDRQILQKIRQKWGKEFTSNNILVVGPKKFGYNHHEGYDYFQSQLLPDQRGYYAPVGEEMLKVNAKMRKEWGSNYLDLMEPLFDSKKTSIKLYTPENKIISFDSGHLTQPGAQYFAEIFKTRIAEFVNN